MGYASVEDRKAKQNARYARRDVQPVLTREEWLRGIAPSPEKRKEQRRAKRLREVARQTPEQKQKVLDYREQRRKDTPWEAREWEYNQKGWTVAAYEAAFEAQGGLCEICGRPPRGGPKGTSRLCADHEHVEPPKPRGLLCSICNRALGGFEDDPELLLAALAYLRKYSAR